MEMANGNVVDLSGLCNGKGTATTAPPAAAVIVTDVTLSGTRFRGKVKNATNTNVGAVTINYTVDSPDATAEDMSSTVLEEGTLAPQQEGTFQGELTKPGNIKILSVTWAPTI